MMNQELSKAISLLRFPLMVLLVFYHFDISSIGEVSGNTGVWQIDLPVFPESIVAFVSWIGGSLCVPMFFLISGILFFHNYDGSIQVYSSKIKKRIRSLLIPYLIWNSLYIVYLIYHHYSHAIPSESLNLSFLSVISQYWDRTLYPLVEIDGVTLVEGAPIYAHFWYIKELILLLLLSPAFYYMIKKCFYPSVITLLLLWLMITDTPNTYQLLLLGFGGMLFLMVGGGISVKGIVLQHVFSSSWWYLPFVIMSIIDMSFRDTVSSPYIHKVNILFGLIAIMKFAWKFVNSNIHINSALVGSSFMIYALHALFISLLITKWCDLVTPYTWYMQLVLWLVVVGSNVLLCVAFDIITKRFTPYLNRLLTGGR